MRVKNLAQVILDVLLCIVGTIIAAAVREGSGYPFANHGFQNAIPSLLLATTVATLVTSIVLGGAKGFWRYPSIADIGKLAVTGGLISTLTTVFMFALNRLEDIPRSLPFIQCLIIIALLCFARAFARFHMLYRRQRRANMAFELNGPLAAAPAAILVVGINSVSSAFIRATAEFSNGRYRVVGLIASKHNQVGRVFHGLKVLSDVTKIDEALDELKVHGIVVERIAVCIPRHQLSDDARTALFAIAGVNNIELQMVIDDLGFSRPEASTIVREQSFSFAPDTIEAVMRHPYWQFKRAFDVVAAALLIIVLLPFLLLGAGAVAISMGLPVAFWQQRPGRGGRPFKVYKLRTMREPVDSSGRRLSQQARQNFVGNVLRRFRIDELPQIWNILVGDMSFIGPRPLLPVDQSEAHRARLLVRPGLTGWAQVIGGRIVSVEDKAALDIWYIRNAGLRLDFEIFVRTVDIIIRGERMHPHLIKKAWAELVDQDICSADYVQTTGGRFS
jgi:lipopolysaccharide/colanic/teichoic acid biosynthesis glycosyltransferase/fluoride ion exporter CrcB/FEX